MTRTVTLLFAIAFLSSCGRDSGSFSMSVSWDRPPEGKVWIWSRVEERPDATQSGLILASAGPEAYEHGDAISLAMSGVTNGDNRRIVVEVREGANPSLAILYYGISEPFSLAPGEHTHVDVPLTLQIPEAAAVKASVELLFDGQHLEQVGSGQIVAATIRTRSANAATIMVANDASFSANVSEFSLDDGDAVTCEEEEGDGATWDVCRVDDWDMTAGLEEEPGDGRYAIFIKFLDRYGYESPVHRASVMLDSQGPLALLASVSPAVARPGTEVLVSITFHELLAEGDGGGTLHVSPELPAGSQSTGPVQVGASTSYLWTLSLPAEWNGAEAFTFTVDARDRLANETNGQPVVDHDGAPAALTVDSLPPVLVAGAGAGISQTLFGLLDEGTPLTFEFVVAEAHPHQVAAGLEGCEGICPTVRLGTTALGTVSRAPELDNGELYQMGFRYEYPVSAAALRQGGQPGQGRGGVDGPGRQHSGRDHGRRHPFRLPAPGGDELFPGSGNRQCDLAVHLHPHGH